MGPGRRELVERKLRIAAGTNPQRRLVLEPGKLVRGAITDPEGKPLAGARVRIGLVGKPPEAVAMSFDDDYITTGKDGRFALDSLGDGLHALWAWHPDYATRRLELTPSGEDLAIPLAAGGTLQGGVVDGMSGKAIVGAEVQVHDIADIFRRVKTAADGSFTLRGVGDWRKPTVEVRATGYAGGRRQVEVKPGETVTVDFRLDPCGRVAGRIVGPDGRGVPSARVEALARGRSGEIDAIVYRTLGRGVSDGQGAYDLAEIEPGSHVRLRVRAKGLVEAESGTFDLQPGGAEGPA